MTHAAAPDRHVVLHHWPRSCSSGVRMLLEELGADYELQVVDLDAGEQRRPEHRAVNPMGKVPALRHGDAVITEQVAVYLYLAGLYPEAGLAPPIGDALRGPYLRRMAFYGLPFEPAMIDHALKRPPVPPSMCLYGNTGRSAPRPSSRRRCSRRMPSACWRVPASPAPARSTAN